jgi:hypothetical protein
MPALHRICWFTASLTPAARAASTTVAAIA